ncbi:hypothetical protein MMC13_001596 [Lambiella insularis]|nr:hypothetical protein [Lambiella insularis]
MSQQPESEGLQVAHPYKDAPSDLEVNESSPAKYPDQAPEPYTTYNPQAPQSYTPYTPYHPQSSGPSLICGLRRRTFFIILAASTVVILAAAIGGGVGGSLSSKSSQSVTPVSAPTSSAPLSSAAAASAGTSSSSSAISSAAPSTTPTPTTSSAPSLTTSTIVSATQTLLRDCPSSNDTIYTVTLGTAQQNFVKNCSMVWVADKTTSDNFIVQQTVSLDDCVQLCAQFNINDHVSSAGEPQTCNSVCWRNGFVGDDSPGMCFGYAVPIQNGVAPTEDDRRCDSALWINQPGT